MSVAQKIKWIFLIIGVTTFTIVLMTLFMPVINSNADTALADPYSSNFTGYREAVNASRWWLYCIPVVCAGGACFFILKAPEVG
jgi:hypothetical protein